MAFSTAWNRGLKKRPFWRIVTRQVISSASQPAYSPCRSKVWMRICYNRCCMTELSRIDSVLGEMSIPPSYPIIAAAATMKGVLSGGVARENGVVGF